jgi:tetratricopeptide (TPR) repeat protein
MANLISTTLLAIPLAWIALPAHTGEPPPANSSTTVIGGNELLQAGADEMRSGNYQRGVELTQEGLKRPNAQYDVAAALSNLCAGFVGLRQYDVAIKHCDESLAINDGNWRTWNNRAAAHMGKGMYDAALKDVEAGLERAPESNTLKKTRTIVMERQRAREQLQRDALRT